jgi:hypothetical protein
LMMHEQGAPRPIASPQHHTITIPQESPLGMTHATAAAITLEGNADARPPVAKVTACDGVKGWIEPAGHMPFVALAGAMPAKGLVGWRVTRRKEVRTASHHRQRAISSGNSADLSPFRARLVRERPASRAPNSSKRESEQPDYLTSESRFCPVFTVV